MSNNGNLKRMVGLAMSGLGAVATADRLRKARNKRDGLAVLSAVLHLASLVVGAAVLVRSMRRGADEDGDA